MFKVLSTPKYHLASFLLINQQYYIINHSISSAFPFNQHANPPILHTSALNFAENESGYNSTNNCSKNINYQNIIVQASYKSCSIIFTANYPISPAFSFEQHANHPNKHTSPYNCPLNQSAHNSTNKSSKNCQLPKHHLQVSQNSSSIIPTINILN